MAPQFRVKPLSMLSIGALGVAIVMQRSHCQVVHVEPNGPPPVWGVVLCVVLRGVHR